MHSRGAVSESGPMAFNCFIGTGYHCTGYSVLIPVTIDVFVFICTVVLYRVQYTGTIYKWYDLIVIICTVVLY